MRASPQPKITIDEIGSWGGRILPGLGGAIARYDGGGREEEGEDGKMGVGMGVTGTVAGMRAQVLAMGRVWKACRVATVREEGRWKGSFEGGEKEIEDGDGVRDDTAGNGAPVVDNAVPTAIAIATASTTATPAPAPAPSAPTPSAPSPAPTTPPKKRDLAAAHAGTRFFTAPAPKSNNLHAETVLAVIRMLRPPPNIPPNTTTPTPTPPNIPPDTDTPAGILTMSTFLRAELLSTTAPAPPTTPASPSAITITQAALLLAHRVYLLRLTREYDLLALLEKGKAKSPPPSPSPTPSPAPAPTPGQTRRWTTHAHICALLSAKYHVPGDLAGCITRLLSIGRRWEKVAGVFGVGVLVVGNLRVERAGGGWWRGEMLGVEKGEDEAWRVVGREWAGAWEGVVGGLIGDGEGEGGVGGEGEHGGGQRGEEVGKAKEMVVGMMPRLKRAWNESRGIVDCRGSKRVRR